MEEIRINRKHKDRLFRRLFGSKEMKENIISLYNALNGTSYTVNDDLTINTIDDVIYITMKNDVSLLLDNRMTLWEHQSTYNPNMPLRGFMYYGKAYDAYITTNKINIFGDKLVKIPTPQYVIFYNGQEEHEAITELRLSDAFIHKENTGSFEWTAIMYNLNKGKNDDFLEKCRPLKEYMTFINYIRDNQLMGVEYEMAVDMAVTRCIEEGIMADFFIKHRAEVKDMVLTEFNEEVFINGIREEGREKGVAEGIEIGREEGRKEGATEVIVSLAKDGLVDIEVAAERLNLSVEEFEKKYMGK